MNFDRQKELYVEQATRAELAGVDETTDEEREVRIRFWRSGCSSDLSCGSDFLGYAHLFAEKLRFSGTSALKMCGSAAAEA